MRPTRAPAHAEVRIADAVVMVAETPRDATLPAMLHLDVPDCDAACQRALAAGATSVRAPTSEADGDRRGGVRDAWGNERWSRRRVPPRTCPA